MAGVARSGAFLDRSPGGSTLIPGHDQPPGDPRPLLRVQWIQVWLHWDTL